MSLTWADGLWVGNVALAEGSTTQFKLLIRDVGGEVVWQTGPNRLVRA